MERAVFYARVSTEEERQLNVIERQIEENRKAIKERGWELVDEYVDRGITGTIAKKRDEYQRLCDDMQEDKFSIIVIKDQDRLMRNTKDWYLFVDHLVQTGKRLFLYLDNKFYTPDDALITGIKAIIAEEFSRNLSKKIKNYNNGRMERAKAGDTDIVLHSIHKAFGWTKKDGKVELDPEQSKVRRLAIDLTLQGKGSTEVAKILNNEGYRNTVGNLWTTQDIPRLVYDEKNVGTVVLNKKYYNFEKKKNEYTDPSEWIYLKNAIPAIITQEEWERLQGIRDKRKTVDRSRGKKAGKNNLFSGKLICGCCGKPYWRKANRNKDQEFWVCSTKQTKGRKTRERDAVGGNKGEINEEGCDNTNISTEALMEMIAAATVMLKGNTDKIKEDMERRLRTIRERILTNNCSYTQADLQKEVQRKDKLLDAYLDGIITKTEYANKIKRIDEKIEAITADIKRNEKKLEEVAEIDHYLENMDQTIADYLNERGDLGSEFILEEMSGVVIYPDGVQIKLPFKDDLFVGKEFQYVGNRNTNFQQHDGAVHQYAVSAV